MRSVDERRMIAAVASFHAENGSWPSAASGSSYERSLGVWLNTQRVNEAKNEMDRFRRDVLDAELPGWRVTPEEAWLTHAREASNFLLMNGRQPALLGRDAGERVCAAWLRTMQSLDRSGSLRPDRARWLDSHCPGWRSTEKAVFPHRKGPSRV